MQITVWASILYLFSLLAVMSGFLVYRKTERVLFGATWLPLSALAVMCYQTLAAAVLELFHLPVNIISVGMFDLLAAVALWYVVLHSKKRQQYTFAKLDIIFWLVLFLVMLIFGVLRYGSDLLLHYNSVDGAAHLSLALSTVNGQSVNAMYYAALHNGLLIELLGPLYSAGSYYKIYVLGDILHLYLAGAMFWGVIRRRLSDGFMKTAGVLTALLYVLGYPANSTMFGFSYFGMCLTLILYMLALADEIMYEELPVWLQLLLLSLGCLGIFESYVLFMPIVFFALLIWLLVRQCREGRLFSVDTVWKGLAVFLVPTVLGLWFTYRGFFGASTGATVSSQISLEGGIYRNLFTNFVLLVPFAVGGVCQIIKEKKNSFVLYVLPLELIFTAGMFFLALQKKVSGYYYYKNYYVIWLLMFVLAFAGLCRLEKNARIMVTGGFLVWCAMAGILVLNLDDAMKNKDELLYGRAEIAPFMDIYAFNYDFLFTPIYPADKLELYGYIKEEMLDEGVTDEVYMVGGWEDSCWMRAVTGTWVAIYDGETICEMVDKKELDYVVVLYGSEEYNMAQTVYDKLERLYETSAGYIARVK